MKVTELIEEAKSNPIRNSAEPFDARITTLLSVHYEQRDEQPFTKQFSISEILETAEDVYSRKFQVGPDWRVLEYGWVEDPPHMLLIENLSGIGASGSSDEVTKAQVLELRTDVDAIGGWLIGPGHFFIGTPANDHPLMIRCLSGVTHFRLTAYAR